MNRRKFLSGAVATLALSAMSPMKAQAAEEYAGHRWFEFARPLMGSITAVAVFAASRDQATDAVDKTFLRIERIISAISEWEGDSASSKLNSSRVLRGIDFSPELGDLLGRGLVLRTITAGLFEPFSLDLSRIWRIAREEGSVPDSRMIQKFVAESRATKASIAGRQILLSPGGKLDTGGFGKGFIADLAASSLRSEGIEFGRVACSGDLRLFGPTEWLIDVEDPTEESDRLGTIRAFGDLAVSTSADNRNCWSVNGTRYHHLIDPRTGQPGRVNHQVTIVAPTAVEADALATGLFFLDFQEAIPVLERAHAQALFVNERYELQISRTPHFERGSFTA